MPMTFYDLSSRQTLVGEIYDEDDEDEVVEDTTSIVLASDGTYTIDGMADLDTVRLPACLPERTLGA